MNSRRNKEISCALGSGTDKHRSFNLDKAVLVKIISCNFCYLVSENDILLQIGTAKVKITVFKSCQLACLRIFLNFKRSCLALCENSQFLNLNFNLAGGNIGVFGTSLPDRSCCGKNILTSNGKSLVKNLFVGAFGKSQLNNACSVSQIDENQCAEVSLTLNPTAKSNLSANILCGKRAAIVRSLNSLHCFHQFCPPSISVISSPSMP